MKGVSKVGENNPKWRKLAILAIWKSQSDWQCSHSKFKKPIRYSESWVNSIKKLNHVSCMTISSGARSSLKFEFFCQRGLKKNDVPKKWNFLYSWSPKVHIVLIFNSWRVFMAIRAFLVNPGNKNCQKNTLKFDF